jgi:phage/plasmid-related protein TIGR03299
MKVSNSDRLAFRHQAPWMQVGKQMTAGATTEEWVKDSGFDFSILSAPVRYSARGIERTMGNANVLYRSDNGVALSTVADKYKVVQPRTVLEFFREMSGKAGLEIESAGTLKGGAIYWALANTGDAFEPIKGDKHLSYVLLYSSANKSLATTAKFIAVRVFCYNTFANAFRRKSANEYRVNHSAVFDIAAQDRVRTHLGLKTYAREWAELQARMTWIAERQLETDQAEAYFRLLLKTERDDRAEVIVASVDDSRAFIKDESKDDARMPRGLDMLMAAYNKAPGAVPGTLYGAFNAVTYYVDHMRGTDASNRMYSAQFSQGNALKDRAMRLAEGVVA